MAFQTIDEVLSSNKLIENKRLFVVCNTKAATPSLTSDTFRMDTEYFSDDEFEELVAMFGVLGIPMDFFTYEDDFIKYILNHPNMDWSNVIVYNAAQSGIGAGRKSLVPAFCNLHNIVCTGSNAYVVSLCRHKYHVNRILAQNGIHVPKTWLYSVGWLQNEAPPSGTKIIVKPIYESASIGIDNMSIQVYEPKVDDFVSQRAIKHRQPMIAQEFVEGYEAESPQVCLNNRVYSLGVVGLAIDGEKNLGGKILDYDRIYSDKYEFYDMADEQMLISEMKQCAGDVVSILGMEGLCRVDFRINQNGSFFVTDVSTNPHFVSHSSVSFSINQLGYKPIHIAQAILNAAIIRG